MSNLLYTLVGGLAMLVVVGCGSSVSEKGPAESTPKVSEKEKQDIMKKQQEMNKKYNKYYKR
jgi:hypothetical protein